MLADILGRLGPFPLKGLASSGSGRSLIVSDRYVAHGGPPLRRCRTEEIAWAIAAKPSSGSIPVPDGANGELFSAHSGVGSLVEIKQEDVDRHPSSFVFFAPHEDAPFPGLFARQIAEK